MSQYQSRLEKAFTLVEIMCVVALTAVLAALIFGSLGSVRGNAQKMKMEQNRYEGRIQKAQQPE